MAENLLALFIATAFFVAVAVLFAAWALRRTALLKRRLDRIERRCARRHHREAQAREQVRKMLHLNEESEIYCDSWSGRRNAAGTEDSP